MAAPTASKTLFSAAVHAAAWGYLGTFIKLTSQLGVQVLLARLLGPAEYGLFAVGVMVVSFSVFFCDFASSALVASKDLSSNDIRFAFTWQIIAASLVSMAVHELAHPIAEFVNDPRAATTIEQLAAVSLVMALGSVSLALLQRKLDFRTIQIAQITGYLVGYVLVALPYALWVEPSVTALVLAWLTQVCITSAIYLSRQPHAWRPQFRSPGGSELLRFGRQSALANMCNWTINNADKTIVARYFPMTQVGLYNTSSSLLSTPLGQIYATFQQVAFSATSRLGSGEQVGQILVGTLALVTTFIGLVYVLTFSNAATLVDLLYGDKWAAAVPYVRIFSLTMFFQAVSGAITPFLWARGAVSRDMRIQLRIALLIVAGGLALAHQSASAIAWWITTVYGLRALFHTRIACQVFHIPARVITRAVWKLMGVLAIVGILSHLSDSHLATAHQTSGVRGLAAVSWAVMALIFMFKYRAKLSQPLAQSIDRFRTLREKR